MKLNPNLTVADYFTPANQAFLSRNDKDLDSGGTLILPDQPGPFPHLLLTGGKQGTLYLIDRDALGGYNTKGDRIVGEFPNALNSQFDTSAYFNGTLYSWDRLDPTTHAKDSPQGVFACSITALSAPTTGAVSYGYPGSSPSISANGTTDGIVWSLDNQKFGTGSPAILRAYDANNITDELYDSAQAGTRDQAGPANKFAVPTIANGKVYVGGNDALTVYGLLPAQGS